MSRKGQSEVITFVLLGGVIVSLVGAAYMWGAPLTEKRSSLAEAESVKAFFDVLNKKITDMSQTCTGTCVESVDIVPKGVFTAFDSAQYYKDLGPDKANEFNNSIILNVSAARSIYALDRWIGLNTGNVGGYANFGEKEGVLMIRMIKNPAGNYESVYKLWFREVDSTKKGFRVDFETGPVKSATTGKITITYNGRFTIPNGAANGKDLEISKIRVDFA